MSLFAAAHAPALAQRWYVEPAIGTQVTATTNASFGEAGGDGRNDLTLEVTPRVRVRTEGGRFRLVGTASLAGLAYLRRDDLNTLAPTADLTARVVAVERLLAVEAGYRASQTNANPFGLRSDSGATTADRLTTSQWRVSPILEAETASGIRYGLRSDNTWTRDYGAPDGAATAGAGGYFGRHRAFVESDPRPFGWRLEAESTNTRYDDDAEPDLRSDLARLTVSYAFAEGFSAGVRGGRERNDFGPATAEPERSIYGVEARWQPTPRTTLSGFREQRFFGSGWNLAFAHRQPRFAVSVTGTRGIDTTPEALLDLPATDNVIGLLDAMFTTRFPDPVERARVVADFVARQGLPTSTLGPITLYSQRLSLVTDMRVSVSYLGSRHTLTLSGFGVRTEDALDQGSLAAGGVTTNNIQTGFAAVWTHRLTSLSTLSLTVDGSRIRALDPAFDDETRLYTVRVLLSQQVAPRTTVFGGARARKLVSNVTPQGREGALLAGLDHRF